jgi:hypothetical protein
MGCLKQTVKKGENFPSAGGPESESFFFYVRKTKKNLKKVQQGCLAVPLIRHAKKQQAGKLGDDGFCRIFDLISPSSALLLN